MPGSSVGNCYICRALAFYWVEHPAEGGWADVLAWDREPIERWFPDPDPPGVVRLPVCWHCYQEASNRAVGWVYPPEVLRREHEDDTWQAPFTNYEREDDDFFRNIRNIPRATRRTTRRRA